VAAVASRTGPLVRLVDGTIEFVCRQCWLRLGYDDYMQEITDADRQALRALRR